MRSRIPKLVAVLGPALLLALGFADSTLWP
jgi:hypothetical protein